jgi:hypothetical protein
MGARTSQRGFLSDMGALSGSLRVNTTTNLFFYGTRRTLILNKTIEIISSEVFR